MTSPLVSIITPVYNSASFIKKTINSVLNQTYTNWELFLINDQSTDTSSVILEEFRKKDKRIHLIINHQNVGPALSRNKGIKEASGKYIAFLDSDDSWLPEKLETQVKYMEEQQIALSFSYYEGRNENGEYLKTINTIPPKVNYKAMLKNNYIGCLTAMYNKDLLGKVYMQNIKKRQDYLLWLDILKVVDYAYCIPEVLALYTVRSNSVSSNKFDLIRYHWKIYREYEGLGIIKSTYYLLYLIIFKLVYK